MVDYLGLKLLGYRRAHMLYNIYDPLRLRYIKLHKYGRIVYPKDTKRREIRFLHQAYKQKLIYERYLNPKGLKTTVTSNFPKTKAFEELLDLKCFLVRSGKQYEHSRFLKFMVDSSLSKPEIQQFLTKLYGLNIKSVRTAIQPGAVRRSQTAKTMRYFRSPDLKKALVEVDFEVPREYFEVFQRKEPPSEPKERFGFNEIKEVIPSAARGFTKLKGVKSLEDVRECLKELRNERL